MFKRVSTFLFLIVSTLSLLGRCGSVGFGVWPQGNSLSTTPIIMLNGYGAGSDIVKGLGVRRSIFLASDNDTVILNIKDSLVTKQSITQALLVPIRKLRKGNIYELCITGLDLNELAALTRENPQTLKYGAIEWMASDEDDTKPPTLSAPITFIKHEFEQYGCGPSEYLNYKAEISEQSEVLLKTTVTNINTKQQQTFYISPQYGMLWVGHGMCSGEFYFAENESYEISFQAMLDISGNTTMLELTPFYFTKPKEPNGY